jgi:hypothetical protein
MLTGALRPIALILAACLSASAQAQDTAPPLPALASASPTDRTQPLAPDELRLANAAVVGGGIVGVAAYGLAKWWDDGFGGSFESEEEGWFGQSTRYGGADKAGHAYAGYFGVRMVSALLQSYGNDRRTAGDIAFWATLGTLTAVEVADGFSKQYKFSPEDAVMNLVGTGFAWWCERDTAVDDLLDFRLYYRQSNESDSWDAFGDYSGQRYLLVAKASGVPQLRDVPIVRYLELAVGYGTKNYDSPPDVARERNVYVGLQLNLSALLNTYVFRDDRWPAARRASEVVLDLWQIPGTGVYAKSTL